MMADTKSTEAVLSYRFIYIKIIYIYLLLLCLFLFIFAFNQVFINQTEGSITLTFSSVICLLTTVILKGLTF